MIKLIFIFGLLCGVIYMAVEGIIKAGEAALFSDPVAMSLKSLKYEKGMFRQHIAITGRGVIHGEWASEIDRDGVHLCGGDGKAPYEGAPKGMSPNDWTDDECPPLRTGDIARVTWEWTDEDGLVRSIGGRLVLQVD